MLPVIISAIENPEDNSLMTEFYLKYNRRLYAEARKSLSAPEDVEDVVLEAFTKIIDKMDVFRRLGPGQQFQYAMTTIRNLSYLHLKKNNMLHAVPFEEMDFEPMLPDPTNAAVEDKLYKQQIAQIWRSLELDDRRLLEQKYILKWSDTELAEGLGIKTASIRMRLTRAKRKVLRQLQEKSFRLSEWL